jgi:hypothetical protein
MAEHSTTFTGPTTIEGLTADRQRMWNGFTSATTGTVIFLVILLAGMAIFLT